MSPFPDSTLQSLTTLVLLFTGYLVYLGVYRLFLHPLARFPGPKLAALSKWYEFYYDVVLGGQFTFHLQDLHKIYGMLIMVCKIEIYLTILGPIIRINPTEIHISDPDFYEELYAKQGRLDKYDWMAGYFGNDTSVFTTTFHDLHKARRTPIQPLFSRTRVLSLQALVRDKNKKMLGKIAQYRESGKILSIDDAFQAFSEDVVFEFCIGQCYDVLDVSDFKNNIHHSFVALSTSGHMAAHLPWIPKTMLSLPESWLEKLDPTYAVIFRLKRDLKQWASDVKEGRNTASTSASHTTVLKAILDSDLPSREKDVTRLRDEAHVVIGAAITTTGWAASVATFHILNNFKINTKLRKELEEAIPDPTSDMDWVQLEKLPYLTACIKEGIRLSIGEANRSPRLSEKIVNYKSWQIPPRTPISMTIADVNLDEEVFPEPKKYIPERWIENKHLDKYIVSFGKGSRSCVGVQLAYAEMYHMIAGCFRLFDFELYETDLSDVEFQHDFAIALPKLDSKGIRVKVKNDD